MATKYKLREYLIKVAVEDEIILYDELSFRVYRFGPRSASILARLVDNEIPEPHSGEYNSVFVLRDELLARGLLERSE